jgi:hypothetical protein
VNSSALAPRFASIGLALLLLSACGTVQTIDMPDAGSTPDGGPAGLLVKVTYNGTSTDVDLSRLPTVVVAGVSFVRLSDVVTAAVTTTTIDLLTVTNFLGSDGFSSVSRPSCVGLLPIDGNTLLTLGYIDPATRNLYWDDTLGYPGCLSVNDVAEIVVANR